MNSGTRNTKTHIGSRKRKRSPSPNRKNVKKKRSILIVGAGPVGLMFAIMMKPYANVYIVEKRKAYTRKQVLVLTQGTLDLLPRPVYKALFVIDKRPGCFVFPPNSSFDSKCYPPSQNLVATVSLNMLEEYLSKYAQELGIKIYYGARWNIHNGKVNIHTQGTKQKKSHFDIIIGADGSKSKMAKLIRSKKKFVEFDEKQYATVFILSKTRKTSIDPPFFNVPSKQNDSRFFLNPKNGYVGFVMGERVFNKIPKGADLDTLPASIKKRLRDVLHLYDINDKLDDIIESISSFEIKVGMASKFSGYADGIKVFLVGDSAISPHFFTSSGFNAGVACAKKLVDIIRKEPSRKWFELYDKVASDIIKPFIESAIQIQIPFKRIQRECKRYTTKELRQMVESTFDVKVPFETGRNDLCYMLAHSKLG